MDSLNKKIAVLMEEKETVTGLNKALIQWKATTEMEQTAFSEKSAEYNERFEEIQEKLSKLRAEMEDRRRRASEIRQFIAALSGKMTLSGLPATSGMSESQSAPTGSPILDGTTDWDEEAWKLLVRKVTVYRDGRAEVQFKGGYSVTVRCG